MSIHKERPKNFNPLFDVASCFIEHEGRILLLHRQDNKPEGNKYCLPSGKIEKEKGEQAPDAILRETKEETGIVLDKKNLFYKGSLYVKYPEHDFTFLTFSYFPGKRLEVKLNEKEHKGYLWVKPEDALSLPLVRDFDSCIKLYYKLK